MGRSRSVQVDVNSSTSDVSKPYRWSAANLWLEEISRDFLGFGFLVLEGHGCPHEIVFARKAGVSLIIF
jgi:hypothetical protein